MEISRVEGCQLVCAAGDSGTRLGGEGPFPGLGLGISICERKTRPSTSWGLC